MTGRFAFPPRTCAWLLVPALALTLTGCASAPPAGTSAAKVATPAAETAEERPADRTPEPRTASAGGFTEPGARDQVVFPPFVEISIDSRNQPLGAYTLTLRFDPRVLQVQEIGSGDLARFPDLPRANPASFASGTVTIAGFQTAGLTPTGRTRVATVFFASAAPGVSSLSASLETLVDPDGQPIPGEVLLSADRVEAKR